nr:serine hydrolase [Cellulomonas algicola]
MLDGQDGHRRRRPAPRARRGPRPRRRRARRARPGGRPGRPRTVGPAAPVPPRRRRRPARRVHPDAGFCLVERVVETVCGVPFADVVHREVVAPLGLTATTAWAGERSAPGARSSTLARVVGAACAGHHRDGSRVDGVRVHYAGPSASGLGASPADVGVLLADLLRGWRGARSVLLDPASAAAMLEDRYDDGVGLGVFVGGPRVMSQGWGVGFQAKLLADRGADRAVAVLLARDPGVPQEESVVGRTVRALTG